MSIASRIEQIEQHLKDDYDVLGLAGAKGTELPIGYTQVDYIESSGTQYIDTGINPISSTKIDIDFAYVGTSSLAIWIPLFGARSIINNIHEYYAVFINQNTLKLTTNYSSNDAGDNSTVYVEVNKKYNLKNNQGSFYINDILESSISASNTLSNNTTHSVYLFDLQEASGNRMDRGTKMKLYSCKFYDGDTLIRNYIPCYRNSDNEVGLYDLVNNVFYANKGTGAFTYGSVVLNRNIQNLKPQWLDRLVYFMNNGLDVVWENWEKVTGTGTYLTLNQTIQAPMKVVLNGNTSQHTTTGKNKFDKDNYTILNGYIRDSAPQVVIASNNTNRLVAIQCKTNTTYTVQKTGGDRFSVFTYNSLLNTDGTYTISNFVRGTTDGSPEPASQTISTGSDTYLYVHLFENINNVNLQEILATIQIEEGSSATSYEEYTGGIASPNPDYPQEIEVVTGLNEVKVDGKNLLDTKIFENRTISCYLVNSNGTITQTATDTNYWQSSYLPNSIILNSGTYTISVNNRNGSTLQIYNLTTNSKIAEGKTDSYTFTLNNDNQVINVKLYGASSYPFTFTMQIEKGSQATTYEEYKGATYEINLGKNLYSRDNGEYNVPIYATDGTSASYQDVNVVWIKVKPNTDYSFTLLPNTQNYFVRIIQCDSNKGFIVRENQVNSTATNIVTITKTTRSNCEWLQIGINQYPTAQISQNNWEVQIEKGSKATTYAPYFTPIELCEIGNYQDYIMKSSGKNIFDEDNLQGHFFYNSNTYLPNSTDNNWNCSKFIKVENNTQYTISLKKLSTSFANGQIIEWDKNKNGIGNFWGNIESKTITTNSNTAYITIAYNNTVYTNAQVEQNSTATQYEPYGYDWYVHKEVGKVVFDGTEYWEGGNSATVSTNYTYVYTQAIDNLAKTGVYTCFNNKFATLNGPMLIDTSVSTDTLSCGSSGYNRLRIMILTSRLSSANVNGFKNWLSNNNVTLYYVLTNPTNTKITNANLISQLEALSNAKSRNSQTNISQSNSNLPFILDVTALRDLQNIFNI